MPTTTPDNFGVTLFLHPRNKLNAYPHLLHYKDPNPHLSVNYMHIGGEGSGHLVHKNTPVPFATRMLVLEGTKWVRRWGCITSASATRDHAVHFIGLPKSWVHVIAASAVCMVSGTLMLVYTCVLVSLRPIVGGTPHPAARCHVLLVWTTDAMHSV